MEDKINLNVVKLFHLGNKSLNTVTPVPFCLALHVNGHAVRYKLPYQVLSMSLTHAIKTQYEWVEFTRNSIATGITPVPQVWLKFYSQDLVKIAPFDSCCTT